MYRLTRTLFIAEDVFIIGSQTQMLQQIFELDTIRNVLYSTLTFSIRYTDDKAVMTGKVSFLNIFFKTLDWIVHSPLNDKSILFNNHNGIVQNYYLVVLTLIYPITSNPYPTFFLLFHGM